jgi:two-component system, OmpR family, sensor histidine kinase MtrB
VIWPRWPRGLRRRLVLTFVLVAAASAGTLAVASYLLVRQARLDALLAVGQAETADDLRLADGITPTRDTLDPIRFVLSYQSLRGTPAVLVFPGHRPVASDSLVDPPIPAALRRAVDSGQVGYSMIRVAGGSYLMTGGRVPQSPAQLYVFFPDTQTGQELGQLRNALAAGWLGVVLLAALAGRMLARRTLEPVARASHAARLIADGQLGTRLPAGARDEFGAWAAAFNEMADALQGKIVALSAAQARERRFTADVAHELRTPLTALVAEVSLLDGLLETMPARARRPTELLVNDVRRLRALVDELMELSRFDAGTERVQESEVELLGCVRSVLRLHGWASRVELAGAEVMLSTDSRRLERIVANLTGNAIEHSGHGVRVSVGRGAAGTACVEVSDAGPGIPPDHLPHIFERFYKADPARSGGSGLGLAIAQENAILLGGRISVRSDGHAGSAFRLTLPLAAAESKP